MLATLRSYHGLKKQNLQERALCSTSGWSFPPCLLDVPDDHVRFFKMLGTDEQRAWYGPTHVALAADRGAVGTLLISDDLFRASDPVQRKSYVELVEGIKTKGGEVLIFSSMHESGQREHLSRGYLSSSLTFSYRAQPADRDSCHPHISTRCGSGRSRRESCQRS